jgi:pyruvate/2-oxoglutarate dehydrogenase complex dihydrolipoamide acyltransferase (E2) component
VGGMRDHAARRSGEPAAPAARSEPRNAEPQPEPERQEPAPRAPVAVGDARVMLYQPKGRSANIPFDILLILVNEGHTGRSTEEGRIALALGDQNRAYKVLTDAAMGALIQSLVAAGYESNAAEFVKGDEQYLAASSGDLPRYQGIISVEHGGVKTKVLGYRKSSESDALGGRRYADYVKLKALVQKWFADSPRSEFPIGGVAIPGKKPR